MLLIKTLEDYELYIDWSVVKGLEIKRWVVEGRNVLEEFEASKCGGSGEEAERLQT